MFVANQNKTKNSKVKKIEKKFDIKTKISKNFKTKD